MSNLEKKKKEREKGALHPFGKLFMIFDQEGWWVNSWLNERGKQGRNTGKNCSFEVWVFDII